MARTGIVNIPGPVTFTRGRMKGSGVGATYDRNRHVLWLLAEAHITVTPDATGGGAVDASASTAGLARTDNYVKLDRHRPHHGGDAHGRSRRDHGDTRREGREDSAAAAARAQPNNRNRRWRAADDCPAHRHGITPLTAARCSRRSDGRSVVELPGAAGAAARRIAGDGHRHHDVA